MINNEDNKVIQLSNRNRNSTRTSTSTNDFKFSSSSVDKDTYIENSDNDTRKETIETPVKIGYNEDMGNNKLQDLTKDIQDLKTQNEVLKDQNITTRWIIGILVSIFGIITPILFNSYSNIVNAKFDSINTEIKSINQRLDYQEKLNSVQIQRDVSIEINKQKK